MIKNIKKYYPMCRLCQCAMHLFLPPVKFATKGIFGHYSVLMVYMLQGNKNTKNTKKTPAINSGSLEPVER